MKIEYIFFLFSHWKPVMPCDSLMATGPRLEEEVLAGCGSWQGAKAKFGVFDTCQGLYCLWALSPLTWLMLCTRKLRCHRASRGMALPCRGWAALQPPSLCAPSLLTWSSAQHIWALWCLGTAQGKPRAGSFYPGLQPMSISNVVARAQAQELSRFEAVHIPRAVPPVGWCPLSFCPLGTWTLTKQDCSEGESQWTSSSLVTY